MIHLKWNVSEKKVDENAQQFQIRDAVFFGSVHYNNKLNRLFQLHGNELEKKDEKNVRLMHCSP